MPEISNYDKYNYDYKNYWQKRKYEDSAEKLALNKHFENLKGNIFVDIGGSFGRNTSIYYNKYKLPIILDYSLKILQKNKNKLKKEYPNLELIAANAYKTPFRQNTIDTTMMIRVLHHLEDQENIFKEISRISKNNSYFILEYANKMHLKALIKWLFTLQLKNFSQKPFQQPNQKNFEGVKEGETTIFLNYHPRYIKKLFNKFKFKIENKISCSFLRTNFLKQNIKLKNLLAIESLLQKYFSWINISPSIIIKATRKEEGTKKESIVIKKLEDILICPKCHSDIQMKKTNAQCRKCKKIFKKILGVWDFRI